MKDALHSLSQWASDSQIHVHKVEQELKAIPQSTSLAQDRQILQNQISKFQHILEINQDFKMTLASIWPHISKYSEPMAYSTMLSSLNQVAANNQDLGGLKNYVAPFIMCLEEQLRFVDKKLSSLAINQLTAPPRDSKVHPPKAGAYSATAIEGGEGKTGGGGGKTPPVWCVKPPMAALSFPAPS